jgi:hypothetical protein
VVEEHESIIFEGLEASSEHGLQISLEREREREREELSWYGHCCPNSFFYPFRIRKMLKL